MTKKDSYYFCKVITLAPIYILAPILSISTHCLLMLIYSRIDKVIFSYGYDEGKKLA